jgi:hypothetical protein
VPLTQSVSQSAAAASRKSTRRLLQQPQLHWKQQVRRQQPRQRQQQRKQIPEGQAAASRGLLIERRLAQPQMLLQLQRQQAPESEAAASRRLLVNLSMHLMCPPTLWVVQTHLLVHRQLRVQWQWARPKRSQCSKMDSEATPLFVSSSSGSSSNRLSTVCTATAAGAIWSLARAVDASARSTPLLPPPAPKSRRHAY